MARPAATRWYAALATLLVFVLLAWMLGAVLPLTEGERTVLRVGLLALGLVAAAALLWYLRPDAPLAPAAGPGKDDALVAVAAARARMPRGAFDQRPLVLLVGTEGSCKTTVVTRAGLDAELLAGDAVGDAPPATGAANLWLAKQAVFAEPGGRVLADEGRWRSVVRALRAPSLGAALGRGEPAPRAAVVCVSCDTFFGDQGQQLESTAQLLRRRLTDAAREFGLALPVYVLFTKADRLPHFEAWAASLTRDEVREPLGAALPFDGDAGAATAAGSYEERLTPRLERAFRELAASLGGRRPALLARESVEERRLAAYELPRELGKLAPAATKFLVELCRPMQLGASPRLRGFYFVGARPVVVADGGGGAAAPAAAVAAPAGAGATSAFVRPNVPGMTPAGMGGYAPPAARKVPQWVFLERLFPEVVLGDGGAAAAARGGLRVSRTRRALLGAGIAAALLVAAGVTTSWLGNRALADRTERAARAVAALPAPVAAAGTVAFPSAEALRTLDALRGTLDTLRTYEVAGPPMRLRWGLWRGGALLDAGRRVWIGGYRDQLHAAAWAALVDSLRTLPEVPRETDDYGRNYAALKAYLIGTAEPARSTADFMAPVLLTSWQRGQPTDAEVATLARQQFAFYAAMLPDTNPFPETADGALVTRTRAFLARYAGAERIYQNMLVEASKAAPPARLADIAPAAAGVVNAPAEVPGAFTAKGWTFMDGAFRDSDRFFQGERWVVGDASAGLTQDRASVLAGLRARYRAEYADRWRQFIRSAAVVRAGSIRAASTQLGIVGGASSPLLAALSLTARHTLVDSAMAAAFQPVQSVTPGAVTDKFVTEKNQPYANALLGLQGAMEQVANMPQGADSASVMALRTAAQQAMMLQASQAKVAARQLAQGFAVDTAAAQVGPAVERLLVAPIESAEAALSVISGKALPRPTRVAAAGGGGAPPPPPPPTMSPKEVADLTKVLNERGRALCTAITPMLAKFPFSPDATAEATPNEVAAQLAPGTGALWQLQQERLEGLLEKQGNQWVPKAGAPIALSGQFVAFFNRAAQVSDALFAGGPEPRLTLTARGVATERVPQVTLVQGSQVARFERNAPPAQFVWPSATGREARLMVVRNVRNRRDRETTIARETGDWALFRLVAKATKAEGDGGGYRAEWGSGDGAVAVEFAFPEGMPVLKRGWLGGMSCAPQVTR